MYDLFSDFFDNFDIFPVYREELKCSNCGKTYSDFQKTGKLGCSECYSAFEMPISRTLKQIQASDTHSGKIPSKQSAKISQKRKLDELKKQLSKAVAEEDYELAAKLHKQIKEMEA